VREQNGFGLFVVPPRASKIGQQDVSTFLAVALPNNDVKPDNWLQYGLGLFEL
jgi:hypothetical protein